MEALEYIKLGEVRLRFVEISGVGTSPAERPAVGALDAAGVDFMIVEDLFLGGAKVLSHHGDHSHLRKIASGQGEIGRSAAQNILHAARGRSYIVERNRSYNENAHAEFLIPFFGASGW